MNENFAEIRQLMLATTRIDGAYYICLLYTSDAADE